MLDCVRGECGVRLEDGPVYTWVAPFFVPEITCLEGNTDQHPKDESIGQDAKRLLRGTLKMWECKHIDVVKRPQLPNERSATVILQGYAVESTRGYGLVGPRSPLLCCKGDSTILRTCNFDYCLLMLSVALGTYFEHHLLILTGPAKQDSAKARNLKRLKRERNDVPVETVV